MSAPPTSSGLQATRRARLADPVFKAIVASAGGLVLIILGWMIFSTSSDAMPIFRSEGLFGFLTGTTWAPGEARGGQVEGTYGALPFLAGTIYSALIAMAIALPLAVGIALYLTQLAPKRVRQPLTYAVDLLAAVPSVVYGLIGAQFLASYLLPVWTWIDARLAFLPFFGNRVAVFNLAFASVVLAIMILPITSAVIREVFAQVPRDERFAAYGLGATRWEVMRHVILPRSKAGIIGGAMLGLGRALGETIAVLLIMGAGARVEFRPFETANTIAAQIAAAFREASPEYIRALMALGVALFLLTMAVNVGARLVVRRFGNIQGDGSL
ncbi:phosphate ABC transporter permease subunit PstC [Nitriliruptoraceae bacterium ZYF776]|nr:phosphate ABC transporter permease subunit PstC [Profundirhabdus halotolerans]